MIKLYSALITDFTQADYTKQYSLLERAIRDRIDAKKRSEDKMRSLAGYILLYRAALELYNKTDFKIYFNENGKPLCDFCYFSISHGGQRVVCAVSDEAIGVDIQEIKAISQRKRYMLFNEKENEYVNSDTDLYSIRFIEIFTKKEAAVKLLGVMLASSRHIDTFSDKFLFETQLDGDFMLTVCRKNK